MSIAYRIGAMEDSQDVFQIFIRTLMDYSRRMNVMEMTGGDDPDIIASLWQKRRPIMSNVPFGKFENYVCFSPGFFMWRCSGNRYNIVTWLKHFCDTRRLE